MIKQGQKQLVIFQLLFVAFFFFSGCTQPDPISTPEETNTSIPATAPSITTEPEIGLAAIDSAETLIRESFPIQVALLVRGDLPDGCTILDQRSQTRNGNAFSIELTTRRDPNARCTEALVPFEEQFELDVLDLKAGTYTININGIVQTFVLTNDNTISPPTTSLPTVTPVPSPTIENIRLFSISGSIFHDLCAVAEAADADGEEIISAGCVEATDGGFSANGIYESNEPPLIGIKVNLSEGFCPAKGNIISAETDEHGQFIFNNIAAGNYCLFVVTSDEPNASSLIPGSWTTPALDGNLDLTISDDTITDPFGWDYQFLPNPTPNQNNGQVRPACIDLFAFDGDVTIPDNAPFEPGSPVIKTWKLINTGSCTWNEDYGLIYLRGDQMDAPEFVPMPHNVAPGETIDITIEMVAPLQFGTYRGDWMMRSDFDQLFGVGGDNEQPIWLQIEVVEADTVGLISGLIWSDACDQSAYTFGDPTLPTGCLQNANGTIRGDGRYDSAAEQPLAGITINIGNGKCGETEFIRSQVSAEDGTYAFPNLLAGTYCVYIEILTDANYSHLIPGNFTVPQPGISGSTVTLESNAEFDSINFAWDALEE